jgi:hypothetical protein
MPLSALRVSMTRESVEAQNGHFMILLRWTASAAGIEMFRRQTQETF